MQENSIVEEFTKQISELLVLTKESKHPNGSALCKAQITSFFKIRVLQIDRILKSGKMIHVKLVPMPNTHPPQFNVEMIEGDVIDISFAPMELVEICKLYLAFTTFVDGYLEGKMSDLSLDDVEIR